MSKRSLWLSCDMFTALIGAWLFNVTSCGLSPEMAPGRSTYNLCNDLRQIYVSAALSDKFFPRSHHQNRTLDPYPDNLSHQKQSL